MHRDACRSAGLGTPGAQLGTGAPVAVNHVVTAQLGPDTLHAKQYCWQLAAAALALMLPLRRQTPAQSSVPLRCPTAARHGYAGT